MSRKVRWYSNGKFTKEEIIKGDPIFHIVKYQHSDALSFRGYRYWIQTIDDKQLLSIDGLGNKTFCTVSMPSEPIGEYEFMIICENQIRLSDYSASRGYYFHDFLKFYSTDDVTF